MTSEIKKIFSNFKVQLFIVFILLTVLCFYFPYTHDDWAWGTSVGIERLNSFFKDYNGRYIGNLFVLALTRSIFLKSITMSIVLTALCYNIYIFINKKNKNIFWLSLIFILLTPKLVFAQSIAWVSGFTNYVIPTLFILMYFNLFKYIFEDKLIVKKSNYLFAILLGFANSLIMENITLFNICISCIFLIYAYWKHKKIDYAQVCFLVAALLGTYLMFSNGAYSMIASNEDNYRSVAQEGNLFISSIHLYFDEIYSMFFTNNVLISIFISFMGIVTVFKYKNENIKKKLYPVLNIIEFILIYYCFFIVIKTLNPSWMILLRYTKYVEGISVLFWCLALCVLVTIRWDTSSIMRKALVAEMSYVILLAPLFVVNPISSRNVFPLYVQLVVLGLCLYEYNKDILHVKAKHLIMISLASYLFLISIYGYVYYCDQRRIDEIAVDKITQDVLKIEKLPYNDYLWTPEPENDMWRERFKHFYDIPEDTEIKFID